MRGAIAPGTVGRLATGRLVIVEKVTPWAAYLTSLPDQQGLTEGSEDNRFFGETITISTTPFVTVYTIDASTLSDENLAWLRQFGLPVDGVPMAEEIPENVDDIEAEMEELKRELERLARGGG